MTPLRVGMLGMWHTHAAGMAVQMASHPDEFRFAAAWDPEPEVVARRQSWRADHHQLRFFDSMEELLRQPLDLIVVEGRVHNNMACALAALESGRPVLLEKPAGVDLMTFERAASLAVRRRLPLHLAYLFRRMSAVSELHRRVRGGELGTPYEFRGRLPKDAALYDTYVAELGRYRGGIFFEMAGHLIDSAVAWMGPPRRVTPFLAHHGPPPRGAAAGPSAPGPAAGSGFIDNGAAVCEFQAGWGIIEVSALECVAGQRRIELYGTQGAGIIPHLGSGHLANDATQTLEWMGRGDSGWQRLELPAATLQIGDLREIAAVMNGQKTPDFSLEHDLAVQETLLRASGML